MPIRLKEVLPPIGGLFSKMPTTIWGTSLHADDLDLELFATVSDFDCAPITRMFVSETATSQIIDVESFTGVIWRRFSPSWQRIWDSLQLEYNIALTSTLDEQRTVVRDLTGLEKVDDKINETMSDVEGIDATDSRTRARNESGTEKTTEDNSRTRSETGSGSDNTRRTGTDRTQVDSGTYGVGGAGLRPTEQTSTLETPDLTDKTDHSNTSSGTERDANKQDRTHSTTGSETENDTNRVDKTTSGTKNTLGDKKTDNNENETTTDVFHSEGSSPLRTYQALIEEEIALRTHQRFAAILIRDVATFIRNPYMRREINGLF